MTLFVEQKQILKLKSLRIRLLIIGLSFVINHVIINYIQSTLDDYEEYIGWNGIRTILFIVTTIIFYFSWKKLVKQENKIISIN